MGIVCGVDGCRAGWVALAKDLDTGCISWRLCARARDLVYGGSAPLVIAIDIPVGLPERGPRVCDLEARKLLGPGRGSSVFPAPIRPVLATSTYENACRIRFEAEGKKMSHQAWGIVYKVREIDEVLRGDLKLQTVVREVHPEVCFYYLAGGQPMRHGKKSEAGKEERRELLEPIFGGWVQAALADRRHVASAEDDILDAFAALWTAERIAQGVARTIPPVPPKDSFGLPMRMVA